MRRWILAACAPALAVGAEAAAADCAPRPAVADYLLADHGERPVARGTASNGGVIEVFASGDRDSFTILITLEDGRSCMVAAGHDWRDLPVMLSARPGAD